jgi:hypothetical protein
MVFDGRMASGTRKDVRDDGVRVERPRGVRRDLWAVAAVGLGLVSGACLLRSGTEPERTPARPALQAPRPAAVATSSHAATSDDPGTPPMTMPRTRAGKLRALRTLGITPTRGPDGKPQIDAAPVIRALNVAGVHDGIAAFPPPGTNPPKSGVVVPDDFELPEGYVRYYQSTDDGEALPPILMFHPDYTFTDEQGNPIAIPENRIVPPELVPPGLEATLLQIPPRGQPR